jgi:hypothetical protein
MTLRLSRCTVGELGELSERRGMCDCRRGTPSADQVSEYPDPGSSVLVARSARFWHARYTSSENTSRKFRLGAHLKKYGTESFRRAVNN